MNPARHRRVPAGTVLDMATGQPKTVTRDYSRACIPEVVLDVAGVGVLMQILPGLRADMAAAAAEEAAGSGNLADGEDDGPEPYYVPKGSGPRCGARYATANGWHGCNAQPAHGGGFHIEWADGKEVTRWPLDYSEPDSAADDDEPAPGYDTRMACGDTLTDAAPIEPGTVLECPRHGETAAISDEQWLAEHPPEIADPGTPFPGRPGYVTGRCGHAVAGSEWRAGFRNCERCGN